MVLEYYEDYFASAMICVCKIPLVVWGALACESSLNLLRWASKSICGNWYLYQLYIIPCGTYHTHFIQYI